MKYLKSVYVFRYDEKEHVWKKHELSRVLVSGTRQSYKLSDTLNRDANTILRVMQNPEADVMPQDVIAFEMSYGDTPPDEGCAVVVSVTRNTQGSNRVQHTKIVCK